MATAFAERELDRRGVDDRVDVLTGGTAPADHVHDVVVETMRDVGIDLADRTPREVTHEDLQACDYVITMGCSAKDVCPATWSGDNRDWDLDDPDGRPVEAVAEIRDEIAGRVDDLLDEVLA